MRKFFKNNGLSLVVFGLFLVTLVGQFFAGQRAYNEEQREHGESLIGMGEYFATGHFWEAVGENWESEFLQMGCFVILTVFLFQKGSAESKDPEETNPVDADPALSRHNPDAPGPVRRGGFALWLYSHSLSLAFLALFLVSFGMHAVGGLAQYNAEQREHGQATVTLMQYVVSSTFWYESFQNWQSEFLSIGAMVVLTVWLREKGSPESKPVATPHGDTGDKEPEQTPPPTASNGESRAAQRRELQTA